MSNPRYNAKPSKNHLILYFDDRTIAKGEDYKRRKKVLHWFFNTDEHLEATVSGTGGNVYRTHLHLKNHNTEVKLSRCSCPVGVDCKHAAALLLTYIDSLDAVQDGETQNSGLSRGMRLKLEELAELLHGESVDPERASSLPPSSVRPSKTYKPRTTLIYVIEPDNWRTRPSIAMRGMSLLADGEFGLETPFAIERLLESQPPAYASPEDLEIAKLWQTVESHGSSNFYYSRDSRRIHPELFEVLFKRVLQSGRCYLPKQYSRPLKLGPRLKGQLAWKNETDNTFRLQMEALGSTEKGESRRIHCLRWNTPWYLDLDENLCGPVTSDINADALDAILLMPPATAKEASIMSVSLNELELADRIPAPPGALPVVVKMIAPAPVLKLESVRTLKPLHSGSKVFAAAGEQLRALTLSPAFERVLQAPAVEKVNGPIIVEKYDENAGEKMGEALLERGFVEIKIEDIESSLYQSGKMERYFVQTSPQQWLDFDSDEIAHLRQLGFQISELTEDQIQPNAIEFEDLEMEVSNERNWWFSLALNIDISGKKVALLPVLLSAIRGLANAGNISDSIEQLNYKGKFVANLADGGVVTLPFERIRGLLLSLEEMFKGRSFKDATDVSVLQVSQLFADAGLAQAPWVGAKKIFDLVERVKKLHKIELVDAPRNFGTTLRPYQLEGLSWLQILAEQELGGILADDMGLGKTVQLLAHVCLQKENRKLTAPFLVVCPTTVLPNWLAECEKFAPHLKVMSFHGKDRSAVTAEMKKADLVITTYPILHRDVDSLNNIEWQGIALDEAQAIKNHATKLSQAARSLKAKYRFCLSGTPVENHLGELWSQFQFLLPGILGDQTRFRDTFRNPIEREGSTERKQLLARRIRPFVLRRTKQEVAKELPEKIYIEQKIELGGSQRDLYEIVRLASSKQIRKEIAQKGFKHSHIMILDALLKLRQVCCDPRLVKLTAARKVTQSDKLDELLVMLEQLRDEERKVLVFSQFTSMLDLIAAELTEREFKFVTITGATRDRRKPVREFQEGEAQVFLISLKAGGTGLNLTAADVVIHYDPWWNPAAEEQATDRAHRIGQTKTVFVYKLIAQGTIEQKMLDMQSRKRQLAGSIYDEKGNVSLNFSESDLEALLAPLDG
ncbi:MAG: DEAD/DEAH box helicase [Candidatus Obscuribacterales bacterium]|nr:DEAD/DEAH box helicase [Candidatus Obscuribacterales bacterium]